MLDLADDLPNKYVFFHVGDDIRQPQVLVDSIRRVDFDAEIIHCTDSATPAIRAVDRRVVVRGDREKLMTYRLQAFAESGVHGTAVYLDTDMICLKPIKASALIGSSRARFCQREFAVALPFNARFRGMDFSEYDGLGLGQVYPYVACTTVTAGVDIWVALLKILRSLPDKFAVWYGDQEAMRRFAVDPLNGVGAGLPESQFACLPEFFSSKLDVHALHFKGPARKGLMFDTWSQLSHGPR